MKYVAFIFVSLIMAYDVIKAFNRMDKELIPAIMRAAAIIAFAYIGKMAF